MSVSVIRVEFEGLAEGGDGRIQLNLLQSKSSETVVSVRVFGVEINDLLEFDSGGVQAIRGGVSRAKLEVGVHVARVDFDHLLEFNNDIVPLPFLNQGKTEPLVSFLPIGGKVNR